MDASWRNFGIGTNICGYHLHLERCSAQEWTVKTWYANVKVSIAMVMASDALVETGFLNPFLYKMYEEHPAAFNDVVKGDNICTEDGCSSTCKGMYMKICGILMVVIVNSNQHML